MSCKKYICYTIKPYKNKDGAYEASRSYYQGYTDLKMFGLAPIFGSRKEDAKKFDTKKTLANELQQIRSDISEYKIEEVD